MNEVISTTGLTKVYGRVLAVNDLNLSVKKGEIFGFPGPQRCREDHHNTDAAWHGISHLRPVPCVGQKDKRGQYSPVERRGIHCGNAPFVSRADGQGKP
jgi:hypothetical protein